MDTRLRVLLRERHWTYSAFCREYERTAAVAAPELAGTAPSRAQLHRWMTGGLKGLPFPDHCRILEKMFPGWTVAQLFEQVEANMVPEGPLLDQLVARISGVFTVFGENSGGWGRPKTLRRHPERGAEGLSVPMAKRLVALARLRRMGTVETMQFAALAGGIVDLGRTVEIDIADDGSTRVRCRRELFNMSDLPVARIAHQFWFQRVSGPLAIETSVSGSHRTSLQRILAGTDHVKFALRISPPIAPGETADIEYSCAGGILTAQDFWRQEIVHYTRHLTLTVRHGGRSKSLRCDFVEESHEGIEECIADDLLVEQQVDGTSITCVRDHLRPGQALTLRWHALARDEAE